VNLTYARSDRFNRSVSTLVAANAGKYIADAIVNVNKLTYFDFKKQNTLTDLRPMPNFRKLGEGMRGEDGLWVGSKITRRCLGYNTERVTNASDLPQQWDDLLTNPRWGDGHLAVVNSYSVWLVPLWQAKGEEWSRNFLYRLRHDVHAQLRKEGENAALGLVAAGEYDGIIVASEYRTKVGQNKGAPLAFYCPGLVPTDVSSLIVMKNSPSKEAALIFANWSISLEGQLLSLAISGQSPVRPELQGARFDYYPDQIEGKTTAFESDLQNDQAKAASLWSEVWGLGK
jgi:ABC-type Fe3+ transport system substrate-binding protein